MNDGIWLPPGARSLGQSVSDDVVAEAKRLAEWFRKWPKPGEKPLGLKDLMDMVLLQARHHLWDRAKAETVLSVAADYLDLASHLPPDPKQGRGKMRAVPTCDHAWRDPDAKFLTCKKCNLTVQRTISVAEGPDPTRASRSDPDERDAANKLPEEKPPKGTA